MNFYDGASQWAVPVFVMISGSLLLDPEKEQSIEKIYRKNIVHIVTVLMCWSLIYALLYEFPSGGLSFQAVYVVLKSWILGHFHMWFLYMIIGLYMVTPLLGCVTKNKSLTRYFLLLGIIFAILVPFITSFGAFSTLSKLAENLKMALPVGYVFYYVLGFYLSSELRLKDRRWIFFGAAICLIGIALTVILTAFVSLSTNVADSLYYRDFSLSICISCVGVFILGLQIDVKNEGLRRVILMVSRGSLGVYMVHIIVLDCLAAIGIDSMMASPVFAIPLTAILTMAISFAISTVLTKIPFARKTLV